MPGVRTRDLKNILTISLEEFTREIGKISSDTLVSLIRGLYDFKWESGKRFSNEQIMDIERKETRILTELKRRNYLNKSNQGEYNDFFNRVNFKKRLF